MWAYIWPAALIILSNTFYQICTKSSPDNVDPFATLTVTYFVGAAVSAVMYFIFNRGGNLIHEYSNLNWAPFVLGITIVGLEAGYLYAYRNGWSVSTLPVVSTCIVTLVMIIVGYYLFREQITLNKIIGLAVCLVGLFIVNMK